MFPSQPRVAAMRILSCLGHEWDGRRSRTLQGEPRLRQRPSFIEGPGLLADGSLLFVDLAWGRLFKVAPEGAIQLILECGGAPNGLAVIDGDAAVIADRQKGLYRLDLNSMIAAPLLVPSDAFPLHALNDVALETRDSFVVTDQGDSDLLHPYGRLLRVTPTGTQVVGDGFPSPNGIALTDEWLHVSLTADNSVWRMPRAAERGGRVSRFLQLSGGTGPDGMSAYRDHLLVAHLGLGVVWIVDPAGRVCLALESPAGDQITNVTVNEATGDVYATEARTGSILVANVSKLIPGPDAMSG